MYSERVQVGGGRAAAAFSEDKGVKSTSKCCVEMPDTCMCVCEHRTNILYNIHTGY